MQRRRTPGTNNIRSMVNQPNAVSSESRGPIRRVSSVAFFTITEALFGIALMGVRGWQTVGGWHT